ncbi:MAG: PAS domain S-box protein [Saprospiraceae bacterium]
MDNHSMLQALFLEATIGIIVVNPAGAIVDLNPHAAKLFGYEKAELLQQKIEVLVPPNRRHHHVEYREKYHQVPVRRSMGANLDLYGLRKDGTEFPIEISLSSMQIEGVRFSLAYVSDDSSKKKVMKELEERKDLLEEAQALAHVGSFDLNLETKRLKCSKELFRIFGLTQEEDGVEFEDFLARVHPSDQSLVREYFQKIIKDQLGLEFSFRILATHKGLRFLAGKTEAKFDHTGALYKIFGLLQDVTELQEAKSISEDIFKLMEESLNEIYIFRADSLAFIQANKGALQNIGYSLSELQNMSPLDLKPAYERSAFIALLDTLRNGSTAIQIIETDHRRKDGSTYPVEVHLQFSRYGTESVFVAFILDISERKKAQQKILNYSNELEQKVIERTQELQESETKLKIALTKEMELGELKSRFVSMASHEFRTPLSSILSSANLLGRYDQTAQQDKRMKHVNRIESSVKNLTVILNDFLSLEKLESGKVRFNPISLDFKEYIQQVLDEVSLMAKPNQKLLHEHTGERQLWIDEHLLKNIILNLLSNGLKYSPEGGDVQLISNFENGLLKIEVKDSGIGIPVADQVHLFTRFFRAQNAATIQGTGLGLTIVKRYLDLMDGKIYFESTENEGSSFFLEIKSTPPSA